MRSGDIVSLSFGGRAHEYYRTVADAIDSDHLKYRPGDGFVIRSNRDISKVSGLDHKVIKKGTELVVRCFVNTAGNDAEQISASSNFGQFARVIGDRNSDSVREALHAVMNNQTFACDGCGSNRPRLDALIVEDSDGGTLTFGMDCVDSVFGLRDSRSKMSQAFGILDGTYFLDDCRSIRDGSVSHNYYVRSREAIDGHSKKCC